MANHAWKLWLGAALVVGAVGCGPQIVECGTAEDCPPTRIVVERDQSREVDLENPVSHRVCFRATSFLKDGRVGDITDVAVWTSDRWDMGSFDRACFMT